MKGLHWSSLYKPISDIFKRFSSMPPDMYVRIERVDGLVEALKSVQANTEICAEHTRSISSTILPDLQNTLEACINRAEENKSVVERLEQKIAACEESIGRLTALT